MKIGGNFDKIDMFDPLSYKTIRNTLYEFRRSGGHESEFNTYDAPGHLFFKVVFHFWNGDADGTSYESGLLAPTWSLDTGKQPDGDGTETQSDEYTLRDNVDADASTWLDSQNPDSKDFTPLKASSHNSAYDFLVRNDELERAEKLRQFVTLLSNISTYSPWYFASISGLDAVLERPFKHDEAYKIEGSKQITIKCMPDGMDNRIGTLVDLYRDVAYSYLWHREMIPANLRKFDMSIYIFESTINQLHWTNSGFAHMYNSNSSMYPRAAFKRIELHDCEFDYNLNKAGYSTIDNAEGFQQTYEIPITVGDAFEYRYNPFIDRSIGDAIAIDMVHGLYKDMKIEKIWRDASQTTDDSVITSLKQRLEKFKYASVDLFGMVNQLTGEVATQFVKSQLLGNLHQTSISDLTRNVKGLINGAMNGNPGAVKAYVDNLKEAGNGWYVKEIGKDNIYTRGTVKNQTEKEPFTPSSIATNKYQETTQPTDSTNKSNQQGSTSTYSSPSQSNLTPYRLWSDVGKTQTIQSTRLSNDVDYDDTLDAPYENIFQKQ